MSENEPETTETELKRERELPAYIYTGAAARMLGCSDQWIRVLCERGRFKGAIRDGPSGRWRVARADIAAFIEASRPRVKRKA